MKRVRDFDISQGKIIALWQLVRLTENFTSVTFKSAISIISNSGLMGGTIPVNAGLKLGINLGFLEIKISEIHSTERCKQKLFARCTTEEPNDEIIRSILYEVIINNNCEWLLFFNEDPEIFKTAIPNEWIEILDFGNLFDFADSVILDWWSEVFSKFKRYKEGQKLENGKVAEKLTYNYEIDRLGLRDTDKEHLYVRWASQISDYFGYDVLSIRGRQLKFSYAENDTIQIEVKCTVSFNEEQFRFYVTKNEWNNAVNNIDSYYFYCWVSLDKDNETAKGPFVIPAKDLLSYFPNDNGTICEWWECRFILNVHNFKI